MWTKTKGDGGKMKQNEMKRKERNSQSNEQL